MLARLALLNLARNRQRTLATGLAVLIGAGALVFADAWSRGIGDAIRQYAASSRLGAMQVHRAGYMKRADALPIDMNVPASGPVLEKLANVEGVTGVTPRIHFTGSASNGTDSTMILATAIDPAGEKKVCPGFLDGDLVAGRLLGPGDEDDIVVGTGLAASLKLEVGAAVTLEARAASGRLNAIDVRVVGIANSSLPDEAKWLVVLPLAAAQRLTSLDDRATVLVLSVGNMNEVERVAAAARAAVDGEGLELHSWREVGLYFEQAIKTFSVAQGFLFVVLAFLVMLVIANAAALSASERAAELATLAAIGAPRRSLRALFLMEAGILGAGAGLLGGLLGVAVAAAASVNGVPFRPPNQPEVLVFPAASAIFVVQAALWATAACALGSFLPAWFAAKQPPAKVLRG